MILIGASIYSEGNYKARKEKRDREAFEKGVSRKSKKKEILESLLSMSDKREKEFLQHKKDIECLIKKPINPELERPQDEVRARPS